LADKKKDLPGVLKRALKGAEEEDYDDEVYWKKYFSDSDYNDLLNDDVYQQMWEKTQQWADRLEIEQALQDLIEGKEE
jgi:hypothetical protein